jgi:hypothetical protein
VECGDLSTLSLTHVRYSRCNDKAPDKSAHSAWGDENDFSSFDSRH